jgi:uncharacterized protein (DUF1697 family)
MRWVVFLRAVNVGGTNLCRPAVLAKQLSKFGVVNIGAVGTFVVREDVNESTLRESFSVQLAKNFGVKCEIMICSAKQIADLVRKDPFERQPCGTEITRFVSVLANRPRTLPALPYNLPSDEDWLFKIIAIQNRFVLGLYRRHMKAIGHLGKIEKMLGVPATTRSWKTIEKIVKIVENNR